MGTGSWGVAERWPPRLSDQPGTGAGCSRGGGLFFSLDLCVTVLLTTLQSDEKGRPSEQADDSHSLVLGPRPELSQPPGPRPGRGDVLKPLWTEPER